MPRTAFVLAVLFICGALGALAAQDAPERKPITVEDLWAMGRVSDPQVSPDGRFVVFSATRYEMDSNKGETALYRVEIAGGEARRLTASGASCSQPRFSPDGKWLYFLSARGGAAQVWRLPLSGGGEAEAVTSLPVAVTGYQPAPDGTHLLVTAMVYPDAHTMEENAERYAEAKKNKLKSTARVYTRLLIRHWNHWRDARRSHVLWVPLDGGTVRDLTAGDHDTPPVSLCGGRGYTIDPDCEALVYCRNISREPAVNTNNDLFGVFVKGGAVRQLTLSTGNDHAPEFAPNGKLLAYLAMERAGFEADRNVLMLRQRGTGKITSLTGSLDRSVGDFVWAPDSRMLYFLATDEGRTGIYQLDTRDPKPKRIFRKGTSASLSITPDGKTLVFVNHAFDRPPEVWALDIRSGNARKVSRVNDAIIARIAFGESKDFWFKGAGDVDVHGFLLTPPGFSAGTDYPAVMLIHGGPQGAFMDSFHWRWNAALWVSPGYVGVIVNFHGSRGYGQKFCDAVSGDWGGKPYEDVMKGLDYALKRYGFIDGNRVGAAGGSYGGFMVNWIEGHTDRFKCLVSHAGLAEHWSMFGATEELWFPLWEFGGAPWDKPELHEKFAPIRFAKDFKTPMLVIHGEHDYRVPYTQGLQMFTALQMRGVKSKLLFFPDANHFVVRPQDAKVWWDTIHGWLREFLKTGGE